MPVSGVARDLTVVAPWAAVVLVLLALLVVVAGGIVGLHLALRGTSEEARPGIIRALGQFFRDLFGRK